MILLRTQIIDTEISALASDLERHSGMQVVYVVDERKGAVETDGREKIGITKPACEALGLYCPDDFAWRCGDYCFYLARARFPELASFWLIESDVRIAGKQPARLFSKFASSGADLITSYLEVARPQWAWYGTLRGRSVRPFKCFFPVVRLSASAIDCLVETRRAQARSWGRRRLWANDEGFVATTLMRLEMQVADLNDGEVKVYRPEQFYFEPAIDGHEPLESAEEVALFHPVLTGEPLRRKQARLALRQEAGMRARGPLSRFQSAFELDRLARLINRATAWR